MSSTMSLRTLLEQNEIVIPIIQRDYAQGRIDASSIRVSFLKEIKNALENGNSLTLEIGAGEGVFVMPQ